MKILHIIPTLQKGGAERLVLDICNELKARENIIVKLITFSDQNAYTDLTKEIDWKVIPASIQLSVYKPNKLHIELLQQEIEKFEPDIIHTHLFEAEIISRSCYYPKAKWFSHGHDNMPQLENFTWRKSITKNRLIRWYEKWFLCKRYWLNGGTTFIAISLNTFDYLKQTVSAFSVTLLHNAINYSKFLKNGVSIQQSNKLVLVNTGSFVDKKNQIFLVEVASYLKSKLVDFSIHLLGDGPTKAKVELRASQLGLQEQVIFHGNVNNVESYLWNSTIYVHSALYEPLGLVLIEAMAAGLPVIALDGKGNRDLIEQGKNGFILYDFNAQTFGDKILEVWKDKKIYSEISNYAIEYASRFDIKEYVDKLLVLYAKS